MPDFDAFASWCSDWTGRGWYFLTFVAGTAAAVAIGWWHGAMMDVLVVWTTVLTVTTQLQAVLLQNTQNRDTKDVRRELSELGRAVPGARDLIQEE